MNTLLDNLDLFTEGFKNTIILFFFSAIFALIIGSVVGAMRVSPVPAARAVGTVYVNLVRNTPLTLILFFFALGYPKLGLPQISFMVAAIIGLSLYTATYIAETIRSGINTVPVGQAEAARAIGLDFGQTLSLVVLPQAVRAVIPPLFSVLIALLKNTTVAAGFSVMEAGAIRANLSERGEPAMVGLLWVALGFIILVALLSLLQRHFEKKWKVAR
ncbi:glutamate transport system permease protein [Arthrobacter woluwensis]|uniref:amino acid ABC transporter permease n=1 Tax=Arthrobacter woluwensis TaxID=156980 RepID=UPI002780CFBF|nr:amino acid ABC transporter permease [Arthrobacter woluwensis]MDQ0709488.1 glutamate transport system permease protein [Arthrobacter woluwensis]